MMNRAVARSLQANARGFQAYRASAAQHVPLVVRITVPCQTNLCAVARNYARSSIGSRTYATTSTTKKAATKGGPKKKKTTTKKTTSKKKPAAKKKSAAKKPPKKQRVKKPVDDMILKVRKIKELKKEALVDEIPKLRPATAYLVYTTENATGGGPGKIGARMQEIAANYRALTPNERDHYEKVARENKDANEQKMKTWISKHTPDEIRKANNARRSLSRMAKEPIPQGRKRALVSRSYKILEDPRQLKRVNTPYVAFAKERFASGDFKGVVPTDAIKQISMEYKDLSPSQLQTYKDRYDADRAKYTQEFNRLFTTKSGRKAKQTAA